MTRTFLIVAGSVWLSAAGAAAQDVTDAQIASIVVTANQVDIDAGRLAGAKSRNPEVKKFAQLMVTDHTGVNKSATELVQKVRLLPQDNPTSQSLKTGGQKNVTHLKSLNGADFDKAYIDHEVEYHQSVLDAIDKTLIPGAKNAELKALLVKVRPAFAAHLDHAKQVQASLGKSH
jgi:putative membrane protein